MVELEDFEYGGTNISSLRIVDPEDEVVISVVQDWVKGEMRFNRKIPFSGKTILVSDQVPYINEILISRYDIFFQLRKYIISRHLTILFIVSLENMIFFQPCSNRYSDNYKVMCYCLFKLGYLFQGLG